MRASWAWAPLDIAPAAVPELFLSGRYRPQSGQRVAIVINQLLSTLTGLVGGLVP